LISHKHINMRWRATITTVFLLSFCGFAYAFRISIPEDVAKKSEAEKTKWLNNTLDEAHKEQLQLGRERYDKRMEDKAAVANVMLQEAVQRREMIQHARENQEKLEKESARQSDAIIALLVIIILPAAAFFLYRRYRSTFVEAPVRTSDAAFKALQTSYAVMQKLKRKKVGDKKDKIWIIK